MAQRTINGVGGCAWLCYGKQISRAKPPHRRIRAAVQFSSIRRSSRFKNLRSRRTEKKAPSWNARKSEDIKTRGEITANREEKNPVGPSTYVSIVENTSDADTAALREKRREALIGYIGRALLFIYMPIFIFLRRELLCSRNWIFLCVFINIPLDGNSLYFQKIGVAGFSGGKRIFSSSSSRDMCL